MQTWFNAKELMAALEKAVDWTGKHGDTDPYVQVVHEDGKRDRLRVLVGFEDGEREFTGFMWDRKEPTHFPYDIYTED